MSFDRNVCPLNPLILKRGKAGQAKRRGQKVLAPTVKLRPFGDIRLRVTGGTRRSLLIVDDLVIGLDNIVRACTGLRSWATRP